MELITPGFYMLRTVALVSKMVLQIVDSHVGALCYYYFVDTGNVW